MTRHAFPDRPTTIARPPGPSGEPVVLDTRVVTGSGGGPDKTILKSPRFLADEGYRMICAYMHPPDDPGFEALRERAEAWGAPLRSIPDRGPWDWRVVAAMLELCRRERVDIWHGHDYKSNVIGLLLRPFHPMKLVTTVHGWVQYTSRTPLYYAIDRACLRLYERVICVSEDLREKSLAGGVAEERCVLIENGIDVEGSSRQIDKGEARRRLGIAPGRLVVGAVGRLSAEKGFDILIRAADQLLREGHDLEVLIAGDGDRGDDLRGLIASLGLGDRVRLIGFCRDPADLYQAIDVFALSSLREGLPNVLLEAMAMGVPVVATRIAGIPRLVVDGQNGLLVEPGSAEAIAGAIATLLNDPEMMARLGLRGRRDVEAGYSFRARIGKIRELYDQILKK